MGRLLRLFLLVSLVAAPLRAQTEEAERLATVGRIWGQVKFFHPWLRYKPIDWDEALVAALPRIRAATTHDEFAAAVGALLERLGDSVTRVEREPAPASAKAPAGGAATPWYRWDGPVLVIALSAVPAAIGEHGFGFSRPLTAELAKADVVLVDARLAGADRDTAGYGFSLFDQRLPPRTVSAPASRAVLLNGYPPQTGDTSGGYYQGFVEMPGEIYTPDTESPRRRLVFLVDPAWIPSLAEALAASGAGSIVATGPLRDTARAMHLALPGGWRAALRVSETIGGPLRADVETREGQDPLAVALALAKDATRVEPKPARAALAEAATAPEWHPDARYEKMAYPDAGYRLLAVYRLWNVIHYFYPYLELIGDWDAVLEEFVPRALAAADGNAYVLTMLEMATRVPDGHTWVWGHPALDEVWGVADPPVELRIIEDQPTIVKLLDAGAARAAGVRLGDVVVAVEGEPAETKMKRLAPWVTASTAEATRARLAEMLLRGKDGATLKATVRGADGERSVALPLSKEPPKSKDAEPPTYRALTPEIGYADLTRLMPNDVDPMFEALKDTKGLILDMRGYPNGTAWAIAPHINVKKAKVGARFRRPLWSGFDLQDDDLSGGASYAFEQPLPPTKGALYTGRTVMLIDERAISQSEHSGLFFEAAADTVFVGTPSAGANGDVTRLTLPGGITVGFTGHDVRHADGRQLQRVGLQPHVRIAPTIAGIRAGKDEVLDRAVQFLRTGE